MKGYITIGSLVHLGVTLFMGVYNAEINPEIDAACPAPLGPYAETCSQPKIYLHGSGDSKSMISYNLDEVVFPSCRMITVCNSQNDSATFNYIEYPTHTQYSAVTNGDGRLHQNGLDFYEYTSSMIQAYNMMKREQIIAQRHQDAFYRGRVLEDKKNSNKVVLRNA